MSGRNLGELGVQHKVRPIYFGWFGNQLRIHPGATELVVADFMEAGQAVEIPDDVDLENPQSIMDLPPERRAQVAASLITTLPMVKNFARKSVHPEDFEQFWSLAMEHGQDSMDLMGVCSTLIDRAAEERTGRPTGPSRGSSGTRRKTGKKSGAKSSKVVDSRQGQFEPASLKVIRRFEQQGRPDLAEIHQMRQEALLASR